MPSLQVRDLPENIYHLLQQRAQADHRSLAQEAVALLAKGLDTAISPKDRRAALLREIAATDKVKINSNNGNLDPVRLVREDRER